MIWFGLIWFYSISNLVDYLMSNPLYTYVYIKYIVVGLVSFHGISTIVGNLMPNLDTYILCIKDLVWLAFMVY